VDFPAPVGANNSTCGEACSAAKRGSSTALTGKEEDNEKPHKM
jgi:hypothetical protein